MSIINKTNQDIQMDRKTMNQLLKATALLDAKIESQYDTVIHKTTPELEYSKTALHLHSIFHILNSALNSLPAILNQLSSQICDLHTGILPYDLVLPKVLKNILLDIQEKLSPTLTLPNTVNNFDLYYKTLHAVLIPEKVSFMS